MCFGGGCGEVSECFIVSARGFLRFGVLVVVGIPECRSAADARRYCYRYRYRSPPDSAHWPSRPARADAATGPEWDCTDGHGGLCLCHAVHACAQGSFVSAWPAVPSLADRLNPTGGNTEVVGRGTWFIGGSDRSQSSIRSNRFIDGKLHIN